MRLYNGDVPGPLSTLLLTEAMCYPVYRQAGKSLRDDEHRETSSKSWTLSKQIGRERERRKEKYTLQNEWLLTNLKEILL